MNLLVKTQLCKIRKDTFDIMDQSWKQHVQSKTLGNLFKSLSEQIRLRSSDSKEEESFAQKLLIAIGRDRFINELKSLSEEVNINFKINPAAKEEPGRVYVGEVTVIWEKGQLAVRVKDYNEWTNFLQRDNKDEIRIILIHSRSLPSIQAKLVVYKTYQSKIKSENIYLHHDYDDYDEISKMSAKQKLLLFRRTVDVLSESIPRQEIPNIIEQAAIRALTSQNIRQLCFDAFIKDDGKNVGTVAHEPYRCYSMLTVRRLKENLADETLQKIGESLGSEICIGILEYIQTKVKAKLRSDLISLRFELSPKIYASFTLLVSSVFLLIFNPLLGLLLAAGTFFATLWWSVDVNSTEWRKQVADEIYDKVIEKRRTILEKIQPEIESLCQKASTDLNRVSKNIRVLEEGIKIIPLDQLMQKWIKREIIPDQSLMKDHPSILQYIAGEKADGKEVVKVFLADEILKCTEDIAYFKKCCKMSDNTKIEFIDVSRRSTNALNKIDKIRTYERNAKPIDMLTRKSLYEVIQKNREKIYARYSNVIGIGISPVRCVGEMIKDETCIVLFCLDKTFIPFGENPLPETIDRFPCDFREDFVKFGRCRGNCVSQILPESGCSIGRPSVNSSGSVGFLVELEQPIKDVDCGFLSASHVALEGFEELYNQNSLLSKHQLANVSHNIVHPSWQDNDQTNNAVGEVVESFCGNFGSQEIGLDFALITNNFKKEGKKERLSVIRRDDSTFPEEMKGKKVIKTGRTTGTTVGELAEDLISIKVNSSFSGWGYFSFNNCYAINTPNFFKEGDSGSGVFVIEQNETLKPLGIAYAFMDSCTVVCSIDIIVDKLDLAIVRYSEDKSEQALDDILRKVTEKQSIEPMDCP